MKSNPLGVVLRMAISLLALGIILYILRDKLSDAFYMIRTEVRGTWFLGALFAYLMGNIILALRLRFVFKFQEVVMSLKEAIHLIFVGLFFNLFLPSAVGGDVAKVYYAAQHSGKKLESTTCVILDRLLGLISLMVLALVAVLVIGKELNAPLIDRFIFMFMGLTMILVLFLASKRFARRFKFLAYLIPSKKWRQKLSDLYHAIYSFKNHGGILWISIFLSFIGQFFFIATYYCTARSLGAQMSPWIFLVLVPMISIVSMAPSLGGLGVREAGSIYLFSRFMMTERAMAISLLIDVVIYGFSLSAGIWYAIRGGLKAKVIHEMGELRTHGN